MHKELGEKVKQGFTRIVKFDELKKNMPETVKISPVVIISYKSRDFRTILYLSFNLTLNGTKIPSINEGIIYTTPLYSMQELGRVIERVIVLMAASPTNSPDFLFSKLDIKDEFWRVNVDE